MENSNYWRRLTRLAACVHYEFPLARRYFYLDSYPVYTNLRMIQRINVEISGVRLKDLNGNSIELFIDEEFWVPDYPSIFVLEAWTKDCLQLGWLVVELVYHQDKIKLTKQEWVPNESYELPEYLVKDFDILVEANQFVSS